MAQQVVHFRQHVDDQMTVQGQGVQVVLKQGSAGHVVERRSDLVADLPLRRAHEAQHGVGQGADGRGHSAVVHRRLGAEDVAGVQEIHQRVAQQRVVGLEVFEQRFLVLHGARQVRDVPADGRVELRGRRLAPGFQVFQGAVQPVRGFRQRIVMGQQTGAGEQYVTVQLGIMYLKDVQCLVHAFPQTRIRVLTAKQQKRQQQQEAGDDPGAAAMGCASRCVLAWEGQQLPLVLAGERVQELHDELDLFGMQRSAELSGGHQVHRGFEGLHAPVMVIGRRHRHVAQAGDAEHLPVAFCAGDAEAARVFVVVPSVLAAEDAESAGTCCRPR